MVQTWIKYLLVFTFFSIAGHAQKEGVSYIYEEVDGKGSLDTIIIENLLGEPINIEFIASGEACKIQVSQPLLSKSLIDFTNTCSDFVKTPIANAIKDSILKREPVDMDKGLNNFPPHLSWLINAKENTKQLDDSIVLRMLKSNVITQDYKHFFKQEKGINNQLIIIDTSEYLISYDPKELYTAIDLRKLELHPEYPKFIDSTDFGAVFHTGHSVLEIDTSKGDTVLNILFVSDGEIWQNVQQLKYISILKVEPFQEFIFILGDAGANMTNHVFVVNRNTGNVFQINPNFYIPKDVNYKRYVSDFAMIEEEFYLFMKTAPSYSDMQEVHFNTLELIQYLRSL